MRDDLQPTFSAQSEFTKVRFSDTYSPSDRADLASGEKDPSQTGPYQLQWRPTEQHFFVVAEGKTVCHVGLVKHTVAVDHHSIRIAGLGGVLTRPECRGHGYALVAMQAAELFALNELRVEFILLFCRPVLRPWYQRQGWAEIPGRVWVEQRQGQFLIPLVTMVRCLGDHQWPPGDIRLDSLPW